MTGERRTARPRRPRGRSALWAVGRLPPSHSRRRWSVRQARVAPLHCATPVAASLARGQRQPHFWPTAEPPCRKRPIRRRSQGRRPSPANYGTARSSLRRVLSSATARIPSRPPHHRRQCRARGCRVLHGQVPREARPSCRRDMCAAYFRLRDPHRARG